MIKKINIIFFISLLSLTLFLDIYSMENEPQQQQINEQPQGLFGYITHFWNVFSEGADRQFHRHRAARKEMLEHFRKTFGDEEATKDEAKILAD